MNNIKSFVLDRFKILSIITVMMSMSIFMLMLRMKLTHSFFYLFLVWNLFLAVIPYGITTYLNYKQTISKPLLAICFLVWLAFLPNAPYIVTDLWHLRLNESNIFWLDILVVTSFASCGLLLFYLSLKDMMAHLNVHLKKFFRDIVPFIIITLSSFGIYLGRFLRYNSWEILSNPEYLFSDIVNIILQPFQHKEAWLFTLTFTLFLNIGYWVFKGLTLKKPVQSYRRK
ncbi:DUF1361 domain-containing protein [Winogradskyella sp. 3972H.M.0a.05]|uniref:DUF1361 domain-containing protein n=1 Tax=Winogradskyella sp. 3972H.M.0a.05 TaxID=2950277 RepID=UPI003390A6F9